VILFGVVARAQTRDEIPPADPENILVDRFTFTIPARWKWQPNTDASSAAARFLIPAQQSERSTDVRFYIAHKSQAETKAGWKGFFEAGATTSESNEKIGNYDITYFVIMGAQKAARKPVPGRKFFGAIIPIENRYVLVRMFGPTAEVDGSTVNFKRMIRDALLDD
jgi:hypothetical protein